MNFPLVVLKMDDGYNLTMNINQICYIRREYDGAGYHVYMTTGPEFKLTWREYDRLDKAFQTIAENL